MILPARRSPGARRTLRLALALALALAVTGPHTTEAAPPAPQQPETVCLQCHGALPDRLGAPVSLWRGSIHAENGISCHACHGGDAKDPANAMNRARGFLGKPKENDIPAFCGRCHPGVMRDYLASAHGRVLGKGGPTCVTCHSNHRVLKASLELISEKNCSRCHSFERARLIRAAMQQTEGYILGIDRRITRFQALGVDTDRLAKGLFAVRNRFHSLFHEVNVARVKRESAQIDVELDKLDRDLKLIEESRAKRKVAGGIAVASLLVTAGLVHLMKKSYE